MSRFAHPGCEPMKGIDYLTLSRYDRNTGEWAMEKAPVYHIID